MSFRYHSGLAQSRFDFIEGLALCDHGFHSVPLIFHEGQFRSDVALGKRIAVAGDVGISVEPEHLLDTFNPSGH